MHLSINDEQASYILANIDIQYFFESCLEDDESSNVKNAYMRLTPLEFIETFFDELTGYLLYNFDSQQTEDDEFSIYKIKDRFFKKDFHDELFEVKVAYKKIILIFESI